jgi:hypothetical protein
MSHVKGLAKDRLYPQPLKIFSRRLRGFETGGRSGGAADRFEYTSAKRRILIGSVPPCAETSLVRYRFGNRK